MYICVRVTEINNSMCCNYRCTTMPQTRCPLTRTRVTLRIDFLYELCSSQSQSSALACSLRYPQLILYSCVSLRSFSVCLSLPAETVYHDREFHHSSPPHLLIPFFVISSPHSLFCSLFPPPNPHPPPLINLREVHFLLLFTERSSAAAEACVS